MLHLETARRTIAEDVDAICDRLGGLTSDQWSAPTKLPGWQVLDLGRHLVWGQDLQAAAWRQLRAGATEALIPSHPDIDAQQVVIDLRRAHRGFDQELADVSAENLQQECPMPYGMIPATLVLQIAAMEIGVHHFDLCTSLGTDHELSDEVTTAGLSLVPLLLGATDLAPTSGVALGTSYQFTGGRLNASVRLTDHGWVLDEGGTPTCDIRGQDAALLLFIVGRLAPDDHRLTVTGSAQQAAMFKTYFPGP